MPSPTEEATAAHAVLEAYRIGQHIGDGVYLSFDGYQLWIAVNNHRNKVAALDPYVFRDLVKAGSAIFSAVQTLAAYKSES